MINIDFNELIEIGEHHRKIIEAVVNATLIKEDVKGDIEVSITICDEKEIKEINNKFRNKNEVTDVLSFPLIKDISTINTMEYNVLGDIIICLVKAIQQSKEHGHSIDREVGFLTAHSMLHLLGYDHIIKEEEIEMFRKQEEILEELKLRR